MGFPTVDLAQPFEGVDAESTANLLERLHKNTLSRLLRVPERTANLFKGPPGKPAKEHVRLPGRQRSAAEDVLALPLQKHIGGNGNHALRVPALALLGQEPFLAEALLAVKWSLEAVLAKRQQGFGNEREVIGGRVAGLHGVACNSRLTYTI